MRQVLSDQRLRSHASLVETLEVTGKNAPALVELYVLGRQAKTHVIVQQLCEVRASRAAGFASPLMRVKPTGCTYSRRVAICSNTC